MPLEDLKYCYSAEVKDIDLKDKEIKFTFTNNDGAHAEDKFVFAEPLQFLSRGELKHGSKVIYPEDLPPNLIETKLSDKAKLIMTRRHSISAPNAVIKVSTQISEDVNL